MERTISKRAGFTLIELMVVVIILVALAGMVLQNVMPATDAAKRGVARADMANIKSALKLYRLHNGSYPTTSTGLGVLMKPSSSSSWKEAYLESEPNDPWGRSYQYKCPGTSNPMSFDLWSQGVSDQDGSDDVKEWEKSE